MVSWLKPDPGTTTQHRLNLSEPNYSVDLDALGHSHALMTRHRSAEELRHDNPEYSDRSDAGERIGQGTRDRDGRIGERGGSCEPIGRGDVQAHPIGDS
jgi:hypothetical protein